MSLCEGACDKNNAEGEELPGELCHGWSLQLVSRVAENGKRHARARMNSDFSPWQIYERSQSSSSDIVGLDRVRFIALVDYVGGSDTQWAGHLVEPQLAQRVPHVPGESCDIDRPEEFSARLG